ncbi:MAG TPA: excinuclease ABC subunit UvrC [Candidatus Krumholzibacteria bacterium]|nr:excinuclease ABC subunit UvrC [Candidatus Krumholzibacteria bacterium]
MNKDLAQLETQLQEAAAKFPANPGVYLFKDELGRVLYVGKAQSLRVRVRSYFRESGDGRASIEFLLRRSRLLEYVVTDTEQEALILENNLIKKHRPRYNVVFKDDKTYVNLRLSTDHPYPRLTVVRRPRRDGAMYFGPFASAGSVRQTLRTIGRIFPMRTCTDADFASRTRPCLYHYIQRCPAPCVGRTDPQDYAETIKRVTMFLKGRGEELLKSLRDTMERQSAERRYEEAARTRDQLFALQRVIERQRISSPQRSERDVFAVYRRGERLVIQLLAVRSGEVQDAETFRHGNALEATEEHLASFVNQYYQARANVPDEIRVSDELPDREALEGLLSEKAKRRVHITVPKRGQPLKLVELALKNARVAFEDGDGGARNTAVLEDLQELLSLERYPRRIECFDISNIQGSKAVGSGVVFIDGEPAKSFYRRYRIRTVAGSDDTGMMREVLERRITRGLKDGNLPDLLIVDGGKGQLNVALDVLKRFGVDAVSVIALAKVRDEKHRKMRGQERVYLPGMEESILLDRESPPLFLLERIRDEAHRFAVGYHRTLRGRGMGESKLDGIPGVGTILKRRLLAEFGSVDRIRKAPVEAVAAVPGLSARKAQAIKDALG